MSPKRTITLCGNFSIREDGHLSPLLRHSKGCALITYLIVTGEVATRQQVALLLWNTTSSLHALGNLRKLLHRIRPLVPNLVVTRRHLAYTIDEQTEIDFTAMQQALETHDMKRLDEALVACGNKQLLSNFYIDNATNFMTWVLSEQVKWLEQRLLAYARLCRYYEERQDWEAAISATRRWLQIAPLDEAVHRRLIQYLSANKKVEQASV